jgi:hypothetical protein
VDILVPGTNTGLLLVSVGFADDGGGVLALPTVTFAGVNMTNDQSSNPVGSPREMVMQWSIVQSATNGHVIITRTSIHNQCLLGLVTRVNNLVSNAYDSPAASTNTGSSASIDTNFGQFRTATNCEYSEGAAIISSGTVSSVSNGYTLGQSVSVSFNASTYTLFEGHQVVALPATLDFVSSLSGATTWAATQTPYK